MRGNTDSRLAAVWYIVWLVVALLGVAMEMWSPQTLTLKHCLDIQQH